MYGSIYWSIMTILIIIIMVGLYVAITQHTICVTPLVGGISAGFSMLLAIGITKLAASNTSKEKA